MPASQIQSLRSVPIIVLTSFGQNISYMHTPGGPAAALQIQDCLEKPVEINVLLNRLGTVLAASSLPAYARAPARELGQGSSDATGQS